MIKLKKDLLIGITDFKIFSSHGSNCLATSKAAYYENAEGEGTEVIADLDITEIENGHFYITQVCNKINIKVLKNGNPINEFDNKGRKLRDSSSDGCSHFKMFNITNNIIKDFKKETDINTDKIIFFDSPFIILSNDWNMIEYHLEFETWFQYNKVCERFKNIIPLLSFNWHLKCTATKIDGLWEILSPDYLDNSSEHTIRNSIKNYSPDDNPLIPDFPRLCETVNEEFFAKYKLYNNV